jgi:hypothetical protein
MELLEGGDAYFPALIQAMDAAVHEVRLETYIFNDDVSGQAVMQALIRAAQRGVQVYLMVDGLGTPDLPQPWLQALAQAGGHYAQFRPLGRLGLLLPGQWRRLHRKLALIDNELAFCGGAWPSGGSGGHGHEATLVACPRGAVGPRGGLSRRLGGLAKRGHGPRPTTSAFGASNPFKPCQPVSACSLAAA